MTRPILTLGACMPCYEVLASGLNEALIHRPHLPVAQHRKRVVEFVDREARAGYDVSVGSAPLRVDQRKQHLFCECCGDRIPGIRYAITLLPVLL